MLAALLSERRRTTLKENCILLSESYVLLTERRILLTETCVLLLFILADWLSRYLCIVSHETWISLGCAFYLYHCHKKMLNDKHVNCLWGKKECHNIQDCVGINDTKCIVAIPKLDWNYVRHCKWSNNVSQSEWTKFVLCDINIINVIKEWLCGSLQRDRLCGVFYRHLQRNWENNVYAKWKTRQ